MKILQIFNRYAQFGGEEDWSRRSVGRFAVITCFSLAGFPQKKERVF